MLVITSFEQLVKYLQTRKAFAERQTNPSGKRKDLHAVGMVYAFEEAIRAVQALNTYLEARELEETPLAPELIDPIDSENPSKS